MGLPLVGNQISLATNGSALPKTSARNEVASPRVAGSSGRTVIKHVLRAALLTLGVGAACLPGMRCARAQVLAQKNWAGSGVSVEVWWKRAVFYRIDPTRFQDSTGSGKGDLAGITQRVGLSTGAGCGCGDRRDGVGRWQGDPAADRG